MADNPTISQIEISGTTYDIQDANSLSRIEALESISIFTFESNRQNWKGSIITSPYTALPNGYLPILKYGTIYDPYAYATEIPVYDIYATGDEACRVTDRTALLHIGGQMDVRCYVYNPNDAQVSIVTSILIWKST